MITLRRFLSPLPNVPTATSWYLSDLGEAKGKQQLFTNQSPQKLKALREHALIESAVSSNRIEGVEVDRARVGTVLFGKALLRDRDEEEVRGYRKALELIHSRGRICRSPKRRSDNCTRFPEAGWAMPVNTNASKMTSLRFFPPAVGRFAFKPFEPLTAQRP